MSESPVKYRRVPGRGRRVQGLVAFAAAQCSLWLGPDHLLSVDRIWMNEEYKRFYFRDIQAITLERTNSATAWNWIHGTLCLLFIIVFGLIGANAGTRGEGRGFFIAGGILGVFWFVVLAVNLIRGPSCVCRLRTAVQTEVLPSLGRVRAALRAIAVLKPLIEQIQGTLAAGEIASRAVAAPVEPRPPRAPPPVSGARARAQAPFQGGAHAALYLSMIVDAAVGIYTHADTTWHFYLVVSTLLLMSVTGFSLAAVVRQREMDVPEGLRKFTGFVFIWVVAVLFVVFIYGFVARVAYSVRHPGALEYNTRFYGMPGFQPISFFADLIEFGLGVAGLSMTMSRRPRPPGQTVQTGQTQVEPGPRP